MKAAAFAVVFALAASVASADDPLVTLQNGGALRGNIGTSRSGRPYYEFLGIPYGKVPLRFGLSEAAGTWTGVRDATKLGSMCVQNPPTGVVGSEDCLFLNVYTPKLPERGSKPLPVLVFVHGGAFILGSGDDYGGNFLMSHDVVYVSFNYRLAAFGYLNAEMEGASGNQAHKDQILALKWVQQNIRNFGGDPNQVTIFGESAGSASVSLLTLSPMSKGLFTRAISQSGAALCGYADRKENPVEETKRLATLLDCPTNSKSRMLKCLRSVKPELIAAAIVPPSIFQTEGVPQFGPGVENFQTNSPTNFLPQSALSLLETNLTRVPWIVGINEMEGIAYSAGEVFNKPPLLEMLNKEWNRIAPSAFFYGASTREPFKTEVSTVVRNSYFVNETTPISHANRQALVNLYGDRMFGECTRETATLYSKFAPVFLYNFTHKVEGSLGNFHNWKYDQKLKPPTHEDDLQFFFPFPDSIIATNITKGHPEEQFSENLIKLWISFAKNGKFKWGNDTICWPRLVKTKGVPLIWMNIGQSSPQLQPEHPDTKKRFDFWRNLNTEIRKFMV